MNLLQAFTTNVGQSIPSPDGEAADAGQCVSWASYVLKNVYNHPYIYANAIDWWQNSGLADAFDFIPYSPGVYPKAGDFVVWGSGVGSQYGHIDECAQDGTSGGFSGYDSNWEDIPKLAQINHDYSLGILGYIRLKENEMTTLTATSLRIIEAYVGGWDIMTALSGSEDATFVAAQGWKDPNDAIYNIFINAGAWRVKVLAMQSGTSESEAEQKLQDIENILNNSGATS